MKIAIRSMVAARLGFKLVMCDLSQAESWVVAYKAGEENMKLALNYGDIHTQTAGSALFYSTVGCPHDWDKETKKCKICSREVTKPMRYIGKRWNHASAYRMGPERAAQVVNKDSDKAPYVVITVKEAKVYSKAWHEYYNLKPWWHSIEEDLGRTRSLRTPYGRKRTFFGAWGQELFKEATAYVPQSTVADHFNGKVQRELGIEGGLLSIYNNLIKPYPDDAYLINQSHDSFMAEVKNEFVDDFANRAAAYLKRPMIIDGEEVTIPVDCEVGERWGEMEGYKVAA